MIALGLVLVALAVLALVAAILGGGDEPASLDLQLFEVDTNTMGIYLLGCATVLVFVAGLEITRSGVRRGYQRRKELKRARQVMKEERRTERPPASDSDTGGSGGTTQP